MILFANYAKSNEKYRLACKYVKKKKEKSLQNSKRRLLIWKQSSIHRTAANIWPSMIGSQTQTYANVDLDVSYLKSSICEEFLKLNTFILFLQSRKY